MVNTQHVSPGSGESACSACGATIKAAPSRRRRRVQCPKCREVVFIESAFPKDPELPAASEPPAPPPPPAPAPDLTSEERSRIELLEARVEALEAALRDSMAAARPPAPGEPERKFLWLTCDTAQKPEFSPEQGRVLFHNLGSVRSQAITIRTPAGDHFARARAEWFKSIFERAGWTVHGPEEVAPNAAAAGLSLAVPEVPVAKPAAQIFFALKAAGFEPITVLDSALPSAKGDEAAAMALTLPPEKAA